MVINHAIWFLFSDRKVHFLQKSSMSVLNMQVLKATSNNDYDMLYKQQIMARRLRGLPRGCVFNILHIFWAERRWSYL